MRVYFEYFGGGKQKVYVTWDREGGPPWGGWGVPQIFFSFVGCKTVWFIDLRYAPLLFSIDSLSSSLNSMFIFSIDTVLISIDNVLQISICTIYKKYNLGQFWKKNLTYWFI